MKNTLVNNVLIDNENRAFGVIINHNGERSTIHARNEVMLSGGVIGSPIILLQSGIGPKDDLNKFNIPIKKELPVGENLVDHVQTYLYFSFHFNETKESKNDTKEWTINRSFLVAFLNTINGTDFPNCQAYYHNNNFPPNSSNFIESLSFDDDVNQYLKNVNKNR